METQMVSYYVLVVAMVVLIVVVFESLSPVQSSVTPWTVAHQAPLSMGFPRQEYWSGLLFSSPGSLPNPRIEPVFPALAGEFFTTEPPERPGSFSSFTYNCSIFPSQ